MKTLTAATLLLFSLGASAQDFSYSYLDLGAQVSKNNETDDKLNLGRIEFSWQSQEGALVQLRYGYGEADELGGRDPEDVGLEDDYRHLSALIGGARQIDERTSAWFGVDFARDRHYTRQVGRTTRFNQYSALLGLRYWLLPRVEVSATGSGFFRENRTSDTDSWDGQLELGLRLYPLQNLSLGISAAHWIDDRVETYQASLRWEY